MAGCALMKTKLLKLKTLLVLEGNLYKEHAIAPSAKKLNKARGDLLVNIKEIGKSGDLSMMVAAEKAIVEDELTNHANSQGMVSSLTAALTELAAAERLLSIVDDKDEYSRVDRSHSLPKNREKDLPLDEARQAFKSHHARLNNLDRARLPEEEKQLIDTRKTNMFIAGKLYAQRQAKTLGVAQG
jgi:DNA-directed RNA polymerase